MVVGSRCVGFAPNFGGGLRKKIKFSERTTFKIIGVRTITDIVGRMKPNITIFLLYSCYIS